MLRCARNVAALAQASRALAQASVDTAGELRWGAVGLQYALASSTAETKSFRVGNGSLAVPCVLPSTLTTNFWFVPAMLLALNVRSMQAAVANLRAESLAQARATDRPVEGAEAGFWSRALLKLGGFYTKEARLIRASRCLHESIFEQGLDTRLHSGGLARLAFPARGVAIRLPAFLL